MKNTFDPYTEYHKKIDISQIVPGHKPLIPRHSKSGQERLTNMHVRADDMNVKNLLTGETLHRENPLPTEFKSVLEISTRSPYCPIPFVLDTMMGRCSYLCRYCFTAQSIESLMTSFFDTDKDPLEPRYANVERTKKYLAEVLLARGVEPNERRTGLNCQKCGNINDSYSLKKASAQRIPLRFGTRSENFLPPEKHHKVALESLKVIADFEYPLIINTKSDLIAKDPYFKVIASMDKNVAVQVTVSHINDKFSKLLEPGAPSATARWKTLKAFNDVGIKGMVRMEPCAHFLNASDSHLEKYMEKAKESGVTCFMGDAYHHTVKAEEVQNLFYDMDVDFQRMWEASSEYQILGSHGMEKAMYYAKKNGMKAGTFNYHSVPWNDDPVCCMVGKQFGSWSKFSMINALRNEFVENPNKQISFTDFDNKYYGMELHPAIRQRLKDVWNLKIQNCFNPDFMEGMIFIDYDSEGNIIWKFDPSRMGEGYKNLIKMFGSN